MTILLADFASYRPTEYDTDDGPWDPISGGASALLGTIGSLAMGVADFPLEIFKSVKQKKETLEARRTSASKDGSSSGSTTPASSSQGHSEFDMRANAPLQAAADVPPTPLTDQDPISPASGKASSENTLRSSSDFPALDTPMTSQSSLSARQIPIKHANSLKDALRGTLSQVHTRSRSRSGSLGSRSGSPKAQQTEFDPTKLTLENSIGAGKSIARIVGAGMKSPMDFTLGIARGFHNAPKLYGDDTVRPTEKVTDFQSGLKAAGKVGLVPLCFRIWDCLTDQCYRNLVMDSSMALPVL